MAGRTRTLIDQRAIPTVRFGIYPISDLGRPDGTLVDGPAGQLGP